MAIRKTLFRYFRTLSRNNTNPIWVMGNTKAHPVLLPQNDNDQETRQRNLQKAKEKYQLKQETFKLTDQHQEYVKIVNVPPMLKIVPSEENRRMLDSIRFVVTFIRYQLYQYWGCISQQIGGWIFGNSRWTIDDMVNQFSFPSFLTEPKGCEVWRTAAVDKEGQTSLQRAQADYWFAWERLNGVTRNLIKQVDTIPEQFTPFVNEIEQDHPYLGNITLEKHAKDGKMYVVDLIDVAVDRQMNILPSMKTATATIAPIALFVIRDKKLMPVAINIENDSGQVYTPSLSSPVETVRPWVNAKIWFGMADASYHESVTHLGFTHLLMDGVSVCMHRNLSDRHPIYKLLHPHFRYMHAINSSAIYDLLGPGAYVDKDMYFNREHMLKLIATHNENWTYKADACVRTNFESRRVMDLPGYFFRDDALSIHSAITEFVAEYVTHYYKNDQGVQLDEEIHGFREELTCKRTMAAEGGCGMNGIPEFTNIKNLVDVLTSFIYICSVEHSATNFPQYEQYAFPPNFPAKLNYRPEDGVYNLSTNMPTKKEMLSTIKIMKVLVLTLTNSLGNYEEEYLNKMDDDGRNFVHNFQKDLLQIEDKMKNRNTDLVKKNNPEQVQEYPYQWLHPTKVRNSISI